MSAIYFHSEHGEALVRGSERAYAGVLSCDLMKAVIGPFHHAKSWVKKIIPADSYVNRLPEAQADSALETWLSSMSAHFLINGEEVETWLVALNTMAVMGNDAMRLLARLHGQCEIHCWVDGPNRKWLADIIRSGRKTDVLRKDQGWEAVATLLESRDDAPVVCSYSVCDQFPNFSCLPEDHPLKKIRDDSRYDKFHDLPSAEAWAACIKGLKSQTGKLELRPEGWEDYRFDTGYSAFSLPRGEKD